MAIDLELIAREHTLSHEVTDIEKFKIKIAKARMYYLVDTMDYKIKIAEARKRYLIKK